jgi:hypothetical protein
MGKSGNYYNTQNEACNKKYEIKLSNGTKIIIEKRYKMAMRHFHEICRIKNASSYLESTSKVIVHFQLSTSN